MSYCASEVFHGARMAFQMYIVARVLKPAISVANPRAIATHACLSFVSSSCKSCFCSIALPVPQNRLIDAMSKPVVWFQRMDGSQCDGSPAALG
jgi:hypothetical protein